MDLHGRRYTWQQNGIQKLNQSETPASNPLVSELVASLVILFENRKGLLEVGLKLLSTFPQPPILIKDVSGFATPSHFACAPVLFLSTCRYHKARALVWKLKTPFKCRLLVLFLSSFLSSPFAFSFPTGWPLVRAVWRMPLSRQALPPQCSRGTQGLLLPLWRGWEKSLEPQSKEKKSPSLLGGGVAPGHREALWFFFWIFPWEDGVEVFGWRKPSWGTGRFGEVQVALMSYSASNVE